MHTLEPEYQELKANGIIDQPTASRAIALDSGDLLSLYNELRAALYASVAAITAGVGILIKNNLDRIGHVTLIAALAVVAAICYATAVRTLRRGEVRSIGGDYVLLLGALLASADLGYVESQFHWLGSYWSWNLLLLAVLHAVAAYLFNSRLVLSVSLTSLAGWFGIQAHIDDLFEIERTLRYAGTQALVCAAAIMTWREIHKRTARPEPFIATLEHFAANIAFWGALSLSFHTDTQLPGLLLVIGLAIFSARTGLHRRQEAFVVYGVSYAALGLCAFEASLGGDALAIVLLAFITIVSAALLLWRFHSRLKAVTQ